MLDAGILEQLKSHFAGLETRITFALRTSAHPKQEELRTMLAEVASCSPKLELREVEAVSEIPHFSLRKDGVETGVHFKAVPGGHEFTSLVLAVLHADRKGRWPDQGILDRVSRLKGPVVLRTYLSLSCTNCPDVVQALNQMALVHPDFVHVALDGELVEAEVEALGIQGVPAVYLGDRLVHVGKADFGQLLEVLEQALGSREDGARAGEEAQDLPVLDVAVVGAGPAGAAAAIYAVRKGQSVAVVARKVGGQVNDTLGIENLISVPRTEGPALARDLRTHLETAGVRILDNRRLERLEDGDVKTLVMAGGERVQARQVILATGAAWRELGVPGEKDHIGKGVAFCPHCDGPFFKGRKVAVVGGGNSGVEAAIDLAGICSHVEVFEFLDVLKADRVLVEKLVSLPNVTVHLHARVARVEGTGQAVTGITWVDRHEEGGAEVTTPLDGIFVQIGLVPNSQSFRDLLETNRAGEIVTDPHGRTSVKGIYAAGDVATTPYKQIIIAMGDGAKTALAAFEDRMRS